MAITIMKRIDFCAGHRLVGHAGKCANFHGHNYRLEIYVTADQLDEVGRVIDFSDLRDLFKGWIDENWDHSFVLADSDSNGIEAMKMVTPHRMYLLPYSPTAENMARYLMDEIAPKICDDSGRGVRVNRLVLWETDSSCAEAVRKETSGGREGQVSSEQLSLQ